MDIGLTDVNLVEVILVEGSDEEEQANGRGFNNGGENTVKIYTVTLCVTIGHEACLKFFDGTIRVALDGEHVVAPHDVGAGWNRREDDDLPRLILDEALD